MLQKLGSCKNFVLFYIKNFPPFIEKSISYTAYHASEEGSKSLVTIDSN